MHFDACLWQNTRRFYGEAYFLQDPVARRGDIYVPQ